jgi:ribose/xylose/arabinose/galactoside ABC-type transport system permease subunit
MAEQTGIVSTPVPESKGPNDVATHRFNISSIRQSQAFGRLLPLVVALVVIFIFGVTQSSNYLTVQNAGNLFQQVAVLGILTAGMTILMVAGQLDLSVGSGAALLGVIAARMLGAGYSEFVVFLVCIGLGILIGLIFGTIIAVTGVAPFVVTLGGLSVLSGIGLLLADAVPIPTGLHFASLVMTNVGPVPLTGLVLVALFVACALLLRYTRLGRQAYAIGSNQDAAFISGIPIIRVKIVLYGLNGALVGLAAVFLIARLGNGDATSGTSLELQALTAAVLGGATFAGGRGSMLGAFLGMLLLGLITNTLNVVGVAPWWASIVYGGILIVAVVWAAIGDLRRQSNVPLRTRIRVALTPAKRASRGQSKP